MDALHMGEVPGGGNTYPGLMKLTLSRIKAAGMPHFVWSNKRFSGAVHTIMLTNLSIREAWK
jgi:hypothetical protein